jgi:hypothetical protein
MIGGESYPHFGNMKTERTKSEHLPPDQNGDDLRSYVNFFLETLKKAEHGKKAKILASRGT